MPTSLVGLSSPSLSSLPSSVYVFFVRGRFALTGVAGDALADPSAFRFLLQAFLLVAAAAAVLSSLSRTRLCPSRMWPVSVSTIFLR